ncbi:GGDEF domain-containing protein [Paenibacillus xanthanilyticus]|uniref:GGDEF domain-containing protein n=1 Tax=Paenibacillus xanthanilyticus TaxID=1783531 RepID=A0ABV8K4A2_9BACL
MLELLIIDFSVITTFFFFTSRIIWSQNRRHSLWNRYREEGIGVLFGIVGAILYSFPIPYYDVYPLTIRYLTILIPIFYFGNKSAIYSFGISLITTAINTDHVWVTALFLVTVVLTGMVGLIVSKQVWSLLKKLIVSNTISIVLFTATIILIEKYNHMLYGSIRSMEILRIVLFFIIESFAGMITFHYIGRLTKEKVHAEHRLHELNQQLQVLAHSDGLTGLFNRRYFNEKLEEHWSLLRTNNDPLSVLLIDVDYFKKYNDYYGHLAGDECLKHVAAAIQGCIYRTSDIVARYGGEEFAVIMPDTDKAGAIKVSERILERIRSLNIAHEPSDKGRLTLSIGLATIIPTADLVPSAIVERADIALYKAKSSGRDQVAVNGPPHADPLLIGQSADPEEVPFGTLK